MSNLNKVTTIVQWLFRIALPVIIILAGVEGFSYLKSRQLKMKRTPPKKQAVLVETISMTPGNYQTYVQVMGTVVPEKQVTLKAKVSGEVVYTAPDFVQGGHIKKGETLLVLDDSDYQIEVKKNGSALEKALADLAIEQGSQHIAKEELKLMNEVSKNEIAATDLALRKPQLVQANAALKSAQADLERARLNLSRTRITVPFNALVLEKQVDLGSMVPVQGSLVTLVDVDTYQIDALVPPDRLSAIRMGEKQGSRAVIHSQYSDQTWEGRVIRTTGKITSNSRMAGVIISVSDPLGLKKQEIRSPLLLDDYVDVQIFGQTLENVYAIPRSFLRDGNTVWVYQQGVLEIKQVSLVWKEAEQVFISMGLQPGDALITTDLPAPVKGMALQLDSGDRS